MIFKQQQSRYLPDTKLMEGFLSFAITTSKYAINEKTQERSERSIYLPIYLCLLYILNIQPEEAI